QRPGAGPAFRRGLPRPPPSPPPAGPTFRPPPRGWSRPRPAPPPPPPPPPGALYGRDPTTDEILEIGGHRPETIWKFDALLDASYGVDLFGRVRRSIQASRADAE